ncbi:hypothetical protein ANCDUO_20161 [Ancylostoma duodenale]|uniref:SCP-like protein n=1 Tax=Ancylostoma duodenale TaxID=51022 RepID=A0A0C2C0J4_9BILA|nr:hypothetical protein ANCDUO_20161 [Ancylostoma duodenale]
MRWLIFVLLVVGSRAEEWDANNFPNPTAGQFRECKMKTTANICDPDGVLSEAARYRLDHDLKQLESRTRQDNAQTFCDKKGVTAAMAVARHVKGGSTEDNARTFCDKKGVTAAMAVARHVRGGSTEVRTTSDTHWENFPPYCLLRP